MAGTGSQSVGVDHGETEQQSSIISETESPGKRGNMEFQRGQFKAETTGVSIL